MHWEVGVGAVEARHKMTFPGAYGTFGRIASVHVWRYELEGDLFLFVELFQGVRCFIVQPVCARFEASICQVGMKFLVCPEDLISCAIL